MIHFNVTFQTHLISAMRSIRFMSYVEKITRIFYLSLFLRNLT